MKTPLKYIAAGILVSSTPLLAETDCLKISAVVKTAIQSTPEQSIEIVAKHVELAPGCSCEIVKTAIQATHADAELVAMIVETAILSAPDQMRIITECAIATAPDALPAVQGVIARLDPNSGDSYSAKSAKSSKYTAKEIAPVQETASMGNPLDFPGTGPVGPGDGLPGGGVPGGDPGSDPIYPPVIFPNDPVDPQPETPTDPLTNLPHTLGSLGGAQ